MRIHIIPEAEMPFSPNDPHIVFLGTDWQNNFEFDPALADALTHASSQGHLIYCIRNRHPDQWEDTYYADTKECVK